MPRKSLSPQTFDRFLTSLENHGDLDVAAREADVTPGRIQRMLKYEDEYGDCDLLSAQILDINLTQVRGLRNRASFCKKGFITKLSIKGIITESWDWQPWYSRSWFYEEKKTDPEFSRDWDEAILKAADGVEAMAWERAFEGTEEPTIFQGQYCYSRDIITGEVKVVTVRKRSDRMMELFLKRHKPEFREQVSIDANLRGSVSLDLDLSQLDDDDIAALESIANKFKSKEEQPAA